MTGPVPSIGFGLMCKAPRPGATKTRLAAAIGPVLAARLSRAFLADCARAAREAADLCQLSLAAFFRPEDGRAELAEVLGPDWPLIHADAGELGATMLDALSRLLRSCPSGAMIMGADVPLISSADIAAAARALREGDARSVVVIPSEDDGYCLIGVRSIHAAAPLFAPLDWSTPKVLPETLARAAAAGLRVKELARQRDIDDIADLDWLRETLKTSTQEPRATRAAISDIRQEREGKPCEGKPCEEGEWRSRRESNP